MSLSSKRFLPHLVFAAYFLYIIIYVVYLCNRSLFLFLFYWLGLWLYYAVILRVENNSFMGARLVLFYHYLGLSFFLQPVFPSVPWLENLFVFLLLFFGEYIRGRYARIVFYGMILFLYIRMVYLGWSWNTSVYSIVFYIIIYVIAEAWRLFHYKNIYPALMWIGIASDVREIHNILFGWQLLARFFVVKPYIALYSVLFDHDIVTRKKLLLLIAVLVIIISNIVDYLRPCLPQYGALLIRLVITPSIVILKNLGRKT